MTTFGDQLRGARASRGIRLSEIAKATKIQERYLAALEQGDFASLPTEVFVKGFIRAYAQYVGADAGRLIAEYERESASRQGPVSPEGEDKVIREMARILHDPDAERRRAERWRTWSWIGGATALVAIALFLSLRQPREAGPATEPVTRDEPSQASAPAASGSRSQGPGVLSPPEENRPASQYQADLRSQTSIASRPTPEPEPSSSEHAARPVLSQYQIELRQQASTAARSKSPVSEPPPVDARSRPQAPVVPPRSPEVQAPATRTLPRSPPPPPAAPRPAPTAPGIEARPPVPPALAPQVAPAGTTGLAVPEHGVGTGIKNRNLVGAGNRFPAGQELWFWTRVVGAGPGATIRHVWIYEGLPVDSIALPLGGAHWRTQSAKTVYEYGSWAVEVRDEAGHVLARSDFTCVPRDQY